jgi:hypothetical protein
MKLKDGSEFHIDDTDLTNWKAGYPGLAVEAELGKMRAWLDANPAKRKTRTGMRRFIVSWLNRATETGGSPALQPDQLEDIPSVFDPHSKDEIFHKLKETMEFFRKEVSKNDLRVWLDAVKGHSVEEIKAAFDNFLLTGKYAPKPVEIRELLHVERQRTGQNPSGEPQKPLPPPAPANVAKAWAYVIRQWGAAGAGVVADPKLTDEEIDDAVLLCNQQVKKSGEWDALPPSCWLESVQGRPYPGKSA